MEEVLKKLETIKQNMATKDDVAALRSETKADLAALRSEMATKADIKELSDRIEKVIDTKVSIIELPDRLQEFGVAMR